MKKIISVIMAGILSMSLLTACGGGKEATASYDVNEVLTTITDAVPLAMPGEVTEEYLTIMMGLDMADVANYAGMMAMVNVSADCVVVIEAAEGKIDTVKAALENTKQSIVNSFELYLPDQFEKAKAGRIVVKGNYAVLAIAGDNETIADKGVEEAYKAVDAAIEEAFK
ncbi:MAG: DUF4358 domain-containing protein [Oscillospiraceae bacterium]|nr:DUF4358 domain-containing protein [Oscillospiraceae bacterium]